MLRDCQRTNDGKLQKNSAQLHPIPVKAEVWNQVYFYELFYQFV